MANKWQYPKWRRTTMQAAMWVVLGGTLGLAALVSHRQEQARKVPLGPGRDVGELVVYLPVGWERTGTDGSDASFVAGATERLPGGAPGRTLTVRRQPLARVMSLDEYLVIARLPTALPPDEPGRADAPARAITMAGEQGRITGFALVQVDEFGGESKTVYRTYYATTVLPSREAIVMTLAGIGPADGDDVDLLQHLAGSLQRKGPPPVLTVATADVQLPGGARVPIPDGFAPWGDADANRVSRTLVADAVAARDGNDGADGPRRARAGASVELVPCVVTAGDLDVDRATLAELHDPRFHGATVSELPPVGRGGRVVRQWRIDPVGGGAAAAGAGLTLRAYLAADRAGAAVLAVFRGGPADATAFDAPWRTMAAGAAFPDAANVAALAEAGARAAATLRARGLPDLMEGVPATRWWLWFRDPGQYVGWSVETVTTGREQEGGEWTGDARTRWREDGAARGYRDAWRGDAGMATYRRSTFRDPPPAAMTVFHGVALVNGRLTTDARPAAAAPRPGRPAPPNFVPGGWLPAILGRLGDDAVLLTTDRFPGEEPATKAGLLTLLIAPDDDLPRPNEDGSGPMRCLTVRVNGSGELSRWYFTPDGQPAQIDLADGMHRKPTDEADVRSGFDADDAMRP